LKYHFEDKVMTKEDIWTHKIKAFLSTSPTISLFPDDEEQTKLFIATTLGLEQNEINLDSLKEIKTIAKGFDIPPFFENVPLSDDMFRQSPIFKHPLSGEEVDLNLDLSGINKTQTSQLITDAITEIRNEIKKQQSLEEFSEEEFYKRLFFAFWRKLPTVIRQKESQTGDVKIGKYWDWLPADPRIPTHSVWEHSSIASAIAGTDSNPALLIFTIASPQQFISTARRTQDSWMGSFIYSFLMWEAIKRIANEIGPDCFLFPDLRRQPLVDRWLETEMKISGLPKYEKTAFQIANFPNILTAIVPFAEADEIAQKTHEAMKNKWREIVGVTKEKVDYAVQNKLKINLEENWEKTWERQAEEFLDQGVYWAACPWQDGDHDIIEVYEKLFSTDLEKEDEEENRVNNLKKLLELTKQQGSSFNSGMTYQCASSLASRGLTTRKNLRDFYNQQEVGDRCSLCGIREAVHPDKTELERKYPYFAEKRNKDDFVTFRLLRQFWQELSNIDFWKSGEQIKFKGRIKRGDRLCAVCLVKRLALNLYFNQERDNGFSFDRNLFPSTSSIAAASFKARTIDYFQNIDNKDSLNTYISQTQEFLKALNLDYDSSAVPELEERLDKIKDKNYHAIVENFLRLDGQWLFKDSFNGAEVEEKIRGKIEESRNDSSIKVRLEDLRSKAQDSLKLLLKKLNFKPSNYYAVISMDGDKISDWLSGKKSPALISLLHPQIAEQLSEDASLASVLAMKRPLGAISHLSLSIALKNFALEVAPQVIEKSGHYGKLLYAGGDDLMAFVPVENLLEIIRELKTFFQGEQNVLNDDFASDGGTITVKNSGQAERQCLVAGTRQDDGDQLTASIGVAIIHSSYPLPHAIEEAFAHAMKENAKDRLERNAVAIHLNKRAGSPLEVGFRWSISSSSNEKDIAASLQKIVGYFKTGQLSSRFGYAMKNWETGLEGKWENFTNKAQLPWWHEAQKKALLKLLQRNSKESADNIIQQTLGNLFDIVFESHLEIFEEIKKRIKKGERDDTRVFEKVVKEMNDKGIDTGWNTLTKLLILARFLAGEDSEE